MKQDQIEINAQDIIEAISAQRDTALNEIARMSAIIRALNRKVEELSIPTSGGSNGLES
jgi:hypothetical protein